jgi:Domain of unknown function (DUF4265)
MTSSDVEGMVKVIIKLEKDEDDYPPADCESLWAMPVADGLFRIDNIPFFARGIAWGDVVSVSPEEGALYYKAVVRPSGHSTLRLIIYDVEQVPAVLELLSKWECSSERSHIPGLIAVDVPPTVSLPELKQFLEEGESQERWGYEEACLGTQD